MCMYLYKYSLYTHINVCVYTHIHTLFLYKWTVSLQSKLGRWNTLKSLSWSFVDCILGWVHYPSVTTDTTAFPVCLPTQHQEDRKTLSRLVPFQTRPQKPAEKLGANALFQGICFIWYINLTVQTETLPIRHQYHKPSGKVNSIKRNQIPVFTLKSNYSMVCWVHQGISISGLIILLARELHITILGIRELVK